MIQPNRSDMGRAVLYKPVGYHNINDINHWVMGFIQDIMFTLPSVFVVLIYSDYTRVASIPTENLFWPTDAERKRVEDYRRTIY